MTRPGVFQVPEASGKQGEMEKKIAAAVICDALAADANNLFKAALYFPRFPDCPKSM